MVKFEHIPLTYWLRQRRLMLALMMWTSIVYYMSSTQCIPPQLLASMKVKPLWKPGETAVGGEFEEVLSLEKALVYCWRACIYFMSPQIVGKGRADSVGVIREVERESESATESCFAQILLSLCVLRDLVAHTPWAVKYWHTGRDTCLV